MSGRKSKAAADRALLPELTVLLVSGATLWSICLAVSLLSQRFAHGLSFRGRPIIFFFLLMTAAFALHLIGLRAAIRLRNHPTMLRWVLLFAAGYRLVLLPSEPIQEVDIYRYMWDGAVVSAGINPYRYSPRDVDEATISVADPDLQALVDLRDSNLSVGTSLQRVHFAHLTTIYPPVSQAVFAAAAFVTPHHAPTRIRLVITKSFVVLFDVLTALGLLYLLRLFGKPEGWVICYAWSPLVLKEFANSGHLDAIAVCLCTWAVYFWLKAHRNSSLSTLTVAAVILGLAVGAKLYPAVLVPIVAVSVWRRFGMMGFATSGGVLALVAVLTIWPMLASRPTIVEVGQQDESDAVSVPPAREESLQNDVARIDEPALPDDFDAVMSAATGSDVEMPLPTDSRSIPQSETVEASQPPRKETDGGLAKFMSSWKMNDLIFLVVHENLISGSQAWFSFLPDSARTLVTGPVRRRTGLGEIDAAFLVTRLLTAGVHLLFVMWLARCSWQASPTQLANYCFLSLAWFWLLLPTLNPWYWIWAMPLLPFARLRTWLLLSGCVVIYYLRFTLQNDHGGTSIAGTGYRGAQFFHFVVVWIEYVPFFVVLLLEWRSRRGRG